MFHICETGGYIPQVHLIVTNISVPTHTHDQQFNWLKKAGKISQMGGVYKYNYIYIYKTTLHNLVVAAPPGIVHTHDTMINRKGGTSFYLSI